MAGAREKFVGDGAREFLRVGVHFRDAVGAARQRVGFEAAAVRRGEDDRQIAGDVFDVAPGAEGGLARIFFGGCSGAKCGG